jgi:hypothetical protein
MYWNSQLRRLSFAAAGSGLVLLSGAVFAAGPASAAGVATLTLINQWKPYHGSAKPSLFSYQGIVHLRGAIRSRSGGSAQPFQIPALYRPVKDVFVKTNLCDDVNGELDIAPDGSVSIKTEGGGGLAPAGCFTSLDGISYAVDATGNGSTTLALQNSWVPYSDGDPDDPVAPAARTLGNVVYLEGAMMSGSNGAAFTMPENKRPQMTVYLPLNMGSTNPGQLVINPNGSVNVVSPFGFNLAQQMTSLDGAAYSIDTTGFTPLGLVSGWTGTTDTAEPAVRLAHGVVLFQGAMRNISTTTTAFYLPTEMTPKKTVYVPVTLCNGANGRLQINADGSVVVQAENDIANAFCMTSIEGASYAL